MSILCKDGNEKVRSIPVAFSQSVEGYAGGDHTTIPFTVPVTCMVGPLSIRASFGVHHRGGTGILGSDLLKHLRVIIDLLNYWLLPTKYTDQAGTAVPAAHRVAAIKAMEGYSPPPQEPEAGAILLRYPDAFAKHKLHCGLVKGEVSIPGPNPQY